jgi:hypothetical protein
LRCEVGSEVLRQIEFVLDCQKVAPDQRSLAVTHLGLRGRFPLGKKLHRPAHAMLVSMASSWNRWIVGKLGQQLVNRQLRRKTG